MKAPMHDGRNLSSAGNPTLEPNITPIGKRVAKLIVMAILYIQDGRQPPSYLGFYEWMNERLMETGNSVIRSPDPETPGPYVM